MKPARGLGLAGAGVAVTTPAVTVPSRPIGAPTEITHSPTADAGRLDAGARRDRGQGGHHREGRAAWPGAQGDRGLPRGGSADHQGREGAEEGGEGREADRAVGAAPMVMEQAPAAASGEEPTARPMTIDPEAPVETAVEVMRERGVHHLPVVDAGGRMVGIVTDRDPRSATFGPALADYLAWLEPTWCIYCDSHAVYRHIQGVP